MMGTSGNMGRLFEFVRRNLLEFSRLVARRFFVGERFTEKFDAIWVFMKATRQMIKSKPTKDKEKHANKNRIFFNIF